ncbi:MAG TPA: hypothetical protein VGK93_05025 [Candidatus Eisenbacteria bacterium]
MSSHRQKPPKPRIVGIRTPHSSPRWDLWLVALLTLAIGLAQHPPLDRVVT